MSKPEKTLGNTAKCEECGDEIICRMTTYKEGTYTNYPQWQNKDENKAHYTNNGKCMKTKAQKSKGDQKPAEQKPQLESTKPSINVKFPHIASDLHDECWAFAMQEAVKVIEKSTISDPSRQVLILAQVFYKKNMDYNIHRYVKKSP